MAQLPMAPEDRVKIWLANGLVTKSLEKLIDALSGRRV
jgi:hypothetical protein